MHTAGGRGIGLETSSGLTVFAPASLACATTYVILEQERWHEVETDFVARWLKPGMTAIDMAAGHGVHALPIARAVGEDGKAIAYEPDRATALLLEESRIANGMKQLVVKRSKPADLAADADELGLDRLDFLRLTDLKAADGLLDRFSPLVMFPVAGGAPDRGLVGALQAKGYVIWRMLTEGAMLVPWRLDQHPALDLNLFAARPELAQQMERLGHLASAPADPDMTDAVELAARLIARLPFVASFGEPPPLRPDDTYVHALAAYEIWRDPARTPNERAGALFHSLAELRRVCGQFPSPGRLSTLARVAFEAGARQTALDALTAQGQFRRPPFNEAFLAAAPRFDLMRPEGQPVEWFAHQILEQGEKLSAPSSFFKASHKENLAWMSADAFASGETVRRLVLQDVRAGSEHLDALQAVLDARKHRNAKVLTAANLKAMT